MSELIDAKGLGCAEPVILAKKHSNCAMRSPFWWMHIQRWKTLGFWACTQGVWSTLLGNLGDLLGSP